MDFARLQLLSALAEDDAIRVSVANDYADLDRWLARTQLLVSYVAGPFLDDAQCAMVDGWLRAGGRWLALHGSAGGKAVPVDGDRRRRRMVSSAHHDLLGGFFLNHPPLRRFTVDVTAGHPITAGVPTSFETADELYFIELRAPANTTVLLSTALPEDPAPGFGFVVDNDTSLGPDGRTRALGFVREIGDGGVAYLALGHCHTPVGGIQPFVDTSVAADGVTPPVFRGSWEVPAFQLLLRNAIAWGLPPDPR